MTVGSYTISSHLSAECRDLIVALLKFSPEDRIALKDLDEHPWVMKMS